LDRLNISSGLGGDEHDKRNRRKTGYFIVGRNNRIKEAELILIDTDLGENNNTPASGDSETGMKYITARASELIAKHPDKREIFENYVRNQQNEYDGLGNTLICVTWI